VSTASKTARPDGRVRLIARNATLAVRGSLGLDEKSPDAAALDLLVGSLAADLLTVLGREAARCGMPLHDAVTLARSGDICEAQTALALRYAADAGAGA